MYRLLLLLSALLPLGCSGSSPDSGVVAQAWAEADALFRSDPRWLGGSTASSVDLGGGRTLWLFSGSYVDPLASGDRDLAFLVSNSVAIQTGNDPSTATIEFFWGDDGGDPAAFFPDVNGEWFRPLHGLRIGATLTILGSRMRFAPGFPERVRTEAFRIDNPDDPPSLWTPQPLAVAQSGIAEIGSALLRDGSHVLAYATADAGPHDVHLLRWDESSFVAGQLGDPEWRDGGSWVLNASLAGAPERILREGADQFSVSADPARARFVLIESHGFEGSFLADKLTVRYAPAPEGPWGRLFIFFRPERRLGGTIMGSGKAHPHLLGADLVATYVPDNPNAAEDLSIGFPRFVRIEFK